MRVKQINKDSQSQRLAHTAGEAAAQSSLSKPLASGETAETHNPGQLLGPAAAAGTTPTKTDSPDLPDNIGSPFVVCRDSNNEPIPMTRLGSPTRSPSRTTTTPEKGKPSQPAQDGLRLGSCAACSTNLVPGNWYHHSKSSIGVCRRCYYVEYSERREEFFWVQSTNDIVRALKPRSMPQHAEISPQKQAGAAQPARTKHTTIVPKSRITGHESLRRAAISLAFKEMVMSSATDSPPRKTGALADSDEQGQRSSQRKERPSILPAQQVTPPRAGNTKQAAVDSPALFWAKPPPPPAQ